MPEPGGKDPFHDIVRGKTYDFVKGRLLDLNMSLDKAEKFALFCQWIYNEVQANHDLSDAFKSMANADKLQPMATQLGLTKSVRTLQDARLSGKAGVVNAFVDLCKGAAEHYGIELNECAFSIAKVALDIASAGVGAVSSVTGVGVVWLSLSIVSTFQDSYNLAQVCFVSQ